MSGTNSDLENQKPRYRLISPEGIPLDAFDSAREAAEAAASLWPGVEQRDHENGRAGWDLEVIR